MSNVSVADKIKDLMPYIISAVVLVCLTALRCVDKISEENFWKVFLLVVGYAIGDVVNIIRFNRLKKLLKTMEVAK